MGTPCPECGSAMRSGWCTNENCPSYKVTPATQPRSAS
jgi:hypothetical protein